MKKLFWVSLIFLSSSLLDANDHYFINLRNKEANGIGYEKGYSSIDFFVHPIRNCFEPIFDFRGHVFNDGRIAANAGGGFRYLFKSAPMIWGMNAFFDYRKSKSSYYQTGLGLEFLFPKVDLRINGYLPFGKKATWLKNFRFYGFQGNNLLIKGGREFAFKAIDLEVGGELVKKHLYAAVAPYYISGFGKHSFGGKVRLDCTFNKYVSFELSGSVDSVFHTIVQGELKITLPFGPNPSCEDKNDSLFSKMNWKVQREEIIPLITKEKVWTAINPETGAPFHIFFVNNLSHSSGTYENPYSTLMAAQNASSENDLIYVFPGDGTFTGMNEGIILKDNQRLLSASSTQFFSTMRGNVTSPVLASSQPKVTTSSGNVIELANNNEIRGLHIIAATGHGISYQRGLFAYPNNSNVSISENRIEVTAPFKNALNLYTYGTINIDNNTISGPGIQDSPYGYDILIRNQILNNQTEVSNISITNNSLSNNDYGLFIDALDGTFTTCTIDSNTCQQIAHGLDVDTSNYMTSTITNNQLSHISLSGISAGADEGLSSTVCYATITNNTLRDFDTDAKGIDFEVVNTGTNYHTTINNNSIINTGLGVPSSNSAGIFLYIVGSARIATAEIKDNVVSASNVESGILVNGSFSTVVSGNAISGPTQKGIWVDTTAMSVYNPTTAASSVLNNLVTNITNGNGILVDSHENISHDLCLSNNTINNCANEGIKVATYNDAYGQNQLIANINGNLCTNVGTNPIITPSGVLITNAINTDFPPDHSSTCLVLNNNTCSTGFQLTNSATGTFKLEPTTGNSGTIYKTGVADIPAGGCGGNSCQIP